MLYAQLKQQQQTNQPDNIHTVTLGTHRDPLFLAEVQNLHTLDILVARPKSVLPIKHLVFDILFQNLTRVCLYGAMIS